MNATPNGACEDYEFDVLELGAGTLAPEKARIVRLHLAGCARCRRWRDEHARLDARLVQAIPKPRLSPDFEWKLASRLRALPGEPDRRADADREYADLMAGLRERLRAAALGSAASAFAVAGCVLGLLPLMLDRLRPAFAAHDATTMLVLASSAIAFAALAWAGGSGAARLRLRP